MQPKTQKNRIAYLDSMRGLAAFMVMVYHYMGWKYNGHTEVKLLNFIFNGSDAVSFFFVLSGFVLSLPYIQYSRSLDLGKFYINRIFRIYPAFIVALILNVLYGVRHELWELPFKTLFDNFIANKTSFWQEALLIRGRSRHLGLDWTLTVEIVMSFFVPYLIMIVFYQRKLFLWFLFSTFLMSNILSIYVLPFALGILISIYYKEIQSDSFKKTIWYRYRIFILLLAVFLFSIRHINHLSAFGPSFMDLLNILQLDFFSCSAIGSFVFIVYTIHFKPVQKVFEKPLLVFIGKISYGIYLIHWVIVAAIFDYWDKILPYFPNIKTAFIVMFIVCATTTIILSYLLYRFIELPFIKKGKKMVASWDTTIEIKPKNMAG